MKETNIKKITIIGSGNVAYHLAKRLWECSFYITQIFSRKVKNARFLAEQVNAEYTAQLMDIERSSDIYIIAISDDAIESVGEELSEILPKQAMIVHTSGATPSTVFENNFQNYGVFYPLQSFSKNKPADFDQIPICLDASNEKTFQQLKKIAERISPKVYNINDEQRAYLHVAAVYVNNFSNYLYHIAAEILDERQIPFELLKPLILETAQKVQTHLPSNMQTGPAMRGDQITMKRHLELLEVDVEKRKLYEYLSKQIAKDMK